MKFFNNKTSKWRGLPLLALVLLPLITLVFLLNTYNVMVITSMEQSSSLRHIRHSHEWTLMVMIPNFRNSDRCGETLESIFANATRPDAIRISLFDQILPNETNCIEEYCKIVGESACRRSQIFNNSMNANDALGPTYARYQTEEMITNEDFCLAIDSHSLFSTEWDKRMIKQWELTNNSHAILTGYPKGPDVRENVDIQKLIMLQCRARIESSDPDSIIQYNAPKWVEKPSAPKLISQIAGGFSFGDCLQAKMVRNDPYLPYLFHGEEYSRASRLWTNGYDFYTPNDDIIFHWYEKRHYYWEIDWKSRWFIQQSSKRRVRAALGLNYSTDDFDHTDIEKFSLGHRRTFQQWINFSNIDPYASFSTSNATQFNNCKDLTYVPYT